MRKPKNKKNDLVSFDQLFYLQEALVRIDAPSNTLKIINNTSHLNRVYLAFTQKKDCYVTIRKIREILKFSLLKKHLDKQPIKQVIKSLDEQPIKQVETLVINKTKRKGRGKARNKSQPHSTFTFRISDEKLDKLNDMSSNTGLPISYFVRLAVDEYIKARLLGQ